MPVARGKALVLVGVVGVSTGVGTWAALMMAVPGPVAGCIGGVFSFGVAWLVAASWPATRRAPDQ